MVRASFTSKEVNGVKQQQWKLVLFYVSVALQISDIKHRCILFPFVALRDAYFALSRIFVHHKSIVQPSHPGQYTNHW